ncbi:MAG: peptidoglycan-associated lipoprotein Pal [Sterolibacterium sp.]
MKRQIFIAAVTSTLLAACSSTPSVVADAPISAPKPAVTTAPVASSAPAAAIETTEQKIARVIKTLANKSVYFDYDDYSIKPQYQDLVKQNYDLLMSAPNLAITLVGNADERGSSEYNLALGQKRAESVKRMLKMLGVPESRLEAISYGKEKPRAICHEEKCWAENRRVDFSPEIRSRGK